MHPGPLLRERRIAKGFSQRQVAEWLGVSSSYVGDRENQKHTIGDLKRLFRWCNHLGISLSELERHVYTKSSTEESSNG